MRIVQDFSETELKVILNDFYKYFETGFEFEDFLKPFLENIGLTEVVVTKKTGDGGVDLTAIKNGLSEINNVDSVKYRVQAKRFSPTTTIAPEKIDALRGNLLFNEKGLFITTAKVSDKAKELAVNKDPSKPVFVIDGIDLVRICIDKQIGFAYKPVFSRNALDLFTNKKTFSVKTENNSKACDKLKSVDKVITANDIRAHIISVPRFIVDQINDNEKKHFVKVIVNNETIVEATFCPNRNYISKITDVLRKYDLLLDDGTIVEKTASWSIDNKQVIYINIK